MLIVVEGPDASGKSTLGEFISNELRIPLVHSGGPIRSQANAYMRMRDIQDDPRSRVLDRIPCISERIYGPILREVDYFEGSKYDLRMLVIYCRPSMRRLLSLDNHRAKEHETQEHVDAVKIQAAKIVHAYDDYFAANPPWLEYNFETASLAMNKLMLQTLQAAL